MGHEDSLYAEVLPVFAASIEQRPLAALSASFLLGGRRAVAIGSGDTGLAELWLDGQRVLDSLRVHGMHAEAVNETPISIERALSGGGARMLERIFVPSDAPVCVIEWRVLESAGVVTLSWRTPHATLEAGQAAPLITLAENAEAFFDCATRAPEFDSAPADANAQRVTARVTVVPSDVFRLIVRARGHRTAPALLARARLANAARANAEQIVVRTPDERLNSEFSWARSQLPSLLGTAAALPSALALLTCGDPAAARELLRMPQKYSLAGDDAGTAEPLSDRAALPARYLAWTGDASFAAAARAAEGRPVPAATSLPRSQPPASERAEAFVACIHSFMDNVLRVEPDAVRHRLTLRPKLPEEWDSLEVERLRMGDALVSFRYERAEDEHLVRVEQPAGVLPVRLILELALPAESLAQASVDGHTAVLDARRDGDRLHVPVQLVLDAPRLLRLTTRGGSAAKKIRPVRADS